VDVPSLQFVVFVFFTGFQTVRHNHPMGRVVVNVLCGCDFSSFFPFFCFAGVEDVVVPLALAFSGCSTSKQNGSFSVSSRQFPSLSSVVPTPLAANINQK
jgi:hypothetical protein